MGICSSCLGLGRRKDSNPETSRLLHNDPYRTHYGSAGHTPHRYTHQPDPETQRREREALEGICHAMSDDVVDVFTVLPRVEKAGANLTRKGHGIDRKPETPESSHDGYKPSPISLKQYKTEDEEQMPQEIAYRSVRKVPVQTRSAITQDKDNLEAAKAVMG